MPKVSKPSNDRLPIIRKANYGIKNKVTFLNIHTSIYDEFITFLNFVNLCKDCVENPNEYINKYSQGEYDYIHKTGLELNATGIPRFHIVNTLNEITQYSMMVTDSINDKITICVDVKPTVEYINHEWSNGLHPSDFIPAFQLEKEMITYEKRWCALIVNLIYRTPHPKFIPSIFEKLQVLYNSYIYEYLFEIYNLETQLSQIGNNALIKSYEKMMTDNGKGLYVGICSIRIPYWEYRIVESALKFTDIHWKIENSLNSNDKPISSDIYKKKE